MPKYFTDNRPKSFYVNILGIKYKVIFCTKEEDKVLETADGYCDNSTHEIIITWFEDDPMNYTNMNEYVKRCIRHEIIHALLYQCGLDSNTVNQWARNEEMVDWIALQIDKITKACEEAEKKYEEAITET